MISFISIIRYNGSMASYRVEADKDHNYVACLLKSTSDKPLPQEITIEKNLALKDNDSSDNPIVNKLICAIRNVEVNRDPDISL